jgi:predicted DNA-binding ribbon-helix-helix protein
LIDRANRPTNVLMAGLRKRSVLLAGHATSIALEPEFWTALETMAAVRGLSLAKLIISLDAERQGRPLASACRVAALAFAQGR